MTYDYSVPAATAIRLVKRFGQSATLRRSVYASGFDPGAATVTDTPCRVAVTDYSTRERDGTKIRVGDKKVLMSTEGLGSIEPTTQDKLLIGGVVHVIVDVSTLSPAGTPVLHTLQVRK